MASDASPLHVLNASSGACMVDVLRAAMREAVDVAVAVSFVRMSGLQLLLPSLADLRDRGARVRVLTSTYMGTTEPQSLRSLRAQHHIDLRVQHGPRGFHAKGHLLVLTRERRVGWVGSSNWSLPGLRDNVEWNARLDGDASFSDAWSAFDALWARDDVRPIDDAFIDAYARSRPVPVPWRAPFEQSSTSVALAESAVAYRPALTPTTLQAEALGRLSEMRATGVRRALVVAATGTGKTLIAAFDALRLNATSLLFVAHRKDIVLQAAREFARVFGDATPFDVVVDGARGGDAPFVFVTIQALLARGGAGLLARRYDYVVVDEFHHADARGWQRALRSIQTGFLLGLTATPERADGRNVMQLCDWNVAYEVRLPAAIRGGFLLPFHYFGVADDLVDYELLQRPGRRTFDEAALGDALSLTARVELLLRHAEEKGFDGPRRVAVAFCAGVAHALFMRREFEARGHRAEAVHGAVETDERARIYAALQDPADPLEWLFVADVLNEGVDLPAINTVVFLRPTESPVVFLQQLGRGLRRHESTRLLTVLDFVGHHRSAFDPLRALHDPAAVPTPRSAAVSRALGEEITPPEGCEILLEDRTLEVLEKVRRMTATRAQRVEAVYRELRRDLERPPDPIDLWDRSDVAPSDVRASFGSWRHLRRAMGDALPWEHDVRNDGPLDRLLRAAEGNHQRPRVQGYAALWAACDPTRDAVAEFARFFAEHPQWCVERGGDARETVEESLAALLKKAGLGDDVRRGGRWCDEVERALRSPEVREALRGRLLPTLATDYRLRHGGVLRTPADLRHFAAYARQEIVNHFGEQYDPARHNTGVIASRVHTHHHVLIARIDTGSAKEEHQYANHVVDRRHVDWSSQNRMRPDNAAGAIVARQEETGARLHLFVAPRDHAGHRYLGAVEVVSWEGAAPMRVRFRLPEALPDAVFDELARS